MYFPKKISAILLALAVHACAFAQEPSLGIYNSLKGFGIQVELQSEDIIHALTLNLDMYGLYMVRTDNPGIMVNYSRNHILSRKDMKDFILEWYVGPGCTAGYVYDFEKGTESLEHNPGGMLALCCTGGGRFSFNAVRLTLDLSLRADCGVHLRKNETSDSNNLTFYTNGIARALYPQLSLLYRF